MSWWRPWAPNPPHDGETCDEVETQLDEALAELNETRAVIRSMFGDRFDDERVSNAVRLAMGLAPRDR